MQEAAVEKPQVRAIFPTYILETRVKDWESLNSGLQAVIAQKRASDPGINRSNLGGWHSDTDMLRWGGEPARRLGLAALQRLYA
jgi:hypothetical protein